MADTFNIMFAGTMGLAQALDAVLEAAGRLQASHPTVRFVFVGGGVDRPRLECVASERRLTNVIFLPRQPMQSMGPILSLADVLLVHLKDDPVFRTTIPSKTQAYLAAGVPILMALRGDAADLVQRSSGGLVCGPEDSAGIAEAVSRFHAMPAEQRQAIGRAGRQFYERELSLAAGVARFEECFARTLHRTASAAP